MGKAKEDKQQPAHVAELLKNNTAVLTAKTRDELAEMVNDIPADVAYQAGAVGHNHETGEYTLRIDIANH
jgi:NCAIR mutase (PurE)-related protein